jgi:riboflavin synthase
MFTGLIEKTGRVSRLVPGGGPARLEVQQPEMASEASPGESIAVNGACLTVSKVSGADIAFDVVGETLARTTLGDLRPGERVNLERALRLGDRLGGHLVQGHVDGVASVESIDPGGEWRRARFSLAPELAGLLVEKGSVAVDGVSLTVAEVTESAFAVALIPTTLAETTLGDLAPGRKVNVETDLIGKYVARLLARGEKTEGGVSLETLRREGFA